MIDVHSEVKLIIDLLTELGYHAEPVGTDRIRVVGTNGLAATIMIYADLTLSLRCRVEEEGVRFELETVNRANHELRFGKFSVDGDGLLLESDFCFDPGGEDAKETLQKIMDIWHGTLVKLRDLLVITLQPG